MSRVPQSAEPSESALLDSRLSSTEFWQEWFRAPEQDVAEALIRLRHFRCWSQEELATRMGTKQPAIARWEAGVGNPTLRTLTQLGIALNATVRVLIEPVELLGREPVHLSWWDRDTACTALYQLGEPTITVPLESTQHAPARVTILPSSENPYLLFATGDHPVIRRVEPESVNEEAVPRANNNLALSA